MADNTSLQVFFSHIIFVLTCLKSGDVWFFSDFRNTESNLDLLGSAALVPGHLPLTLFLISLKLYNPKPAFHYLYIAKIPSSCSSSFSLSECLWVDIALITGFRGLLPVRFHFMFSLILRYTSTGAFSQYATSPGILARCCLNLFMPPLIIFSQSLHLTLFFFSSWGTKCSHQVLCVLMSGEGRIHYLSCHKSLLSFLSVYNLYLLLPFHYIH